MGEMQNISELYNAMPAEHRRISQVFEMEIQIRQLHIFKRELKADYQRRSKKIDEQIKYFERERASRIRKITEAGPS